MNISALSYIRTPDLSNRAAADLAVGCTVTGISFLQLLP